MLPRKYYIVVAAASVVLATYLIGVSTTSDFDAFAKRAIRDLGHSPEPVVTQRLLRHLSEKRVQNVTEYLEQNANRGYYEVAIADAGLSPNQRESLAGRSATKLTVFSSQYFNTVVSRYELRILVYENASNLEQIEAYVFFHSL
ncbi:hypothetical protein SAMN05444007_11512 [Cribrihabitans marinus]|uniref:Uncharacterized protein n=1 Tax=Cribrihabitans marinus TaxID=1227549 RepID=A0A1H7DXQ5_9RHOB|nr:hypothetical protein GCM10010973_37430 [Cribrihabitans marinus]SEK05607.1 hypothetical protein SAMN05444007_11512 [Cribrihabitans marinus]